MRALRWLGQLWASPATLVGLVVALLSGCRLRRRGRALLFVPSGRGPAAWWLERFSFRAFTVGAVIVVRELWLDDREVIAHELRHVDQFLVLGVLQPVLYLACSAWELLRGGHWHDGNFFERDAAAAASRAVQEAA